MFTSESITAEDVVGLKEKYPGVPVVTYVNTSAEVKAESDICCTSGNAQRVIESLWVRKVILFQINISPKISQKRLILKRHMG